MSVSADAQKRTVKSVRYTGVIFDRGRDAGKAILNLNIDQNGIFTGTGDLTLTNRFMNEPGPHSGPVKFKFCASWSDLTAKIRKPPAGVFQGTEQFQLGWGDSSERISRNCFKSRQGKVKPNLEILSGRMGPLHFTVASEQYYKTQKQEEEAKEKKAAAEKEDSEKPEHILESKYIQYMTIKECHRISSWYINTREMKTAKSKIRSIQDYLKGKNKTMDTDAIWESASKNWDKEMASSFKILSVIGQYSKDVEGICKLQFMGLSSVRIPGAKMKTRKKDF